MALHEVQQVQLDNALLLVEVEPQQENKNDSKFNELWEWLDAAGKLETEPDEPPTTS